MEKTEPIELLKKYITKNKKIKQEEGNLIFGARRLPMNTPTAWKPKNSEKRYCLGDLWLFLKYKLNHDGPLTDYYKEITNLKDTIKIQIVSVPHQEDIVKYFSGQIDVTDNIDENLREYVKATNLMKRCKYFN